MQKVLVGLTGTVGAGKSTVGGILTNLGADVVSGDELGRKAVEDSPALLNEIRTRFGNEVFSASGALNRRALGQRVFQSPEDAQWLTVQTFPAIHSLWQECVRRSQKSVIVLDAALIFEWGIESEFDTVIAVVARPEIVVERLAMTGRLTPREVSARTAAQLSVERKISKASLTISNNDSLAKLNESVREFWSTIVEPLLELRRNY